MRHLTLIGSEHSHYCNQSLLCSRHTPAPISLIPGSIPCYQAFRIYTLSTLTLFPCHARRYFKPSGKRNGRAHQHQHQHHRCKMRRCTPHGSPRTRRRLQSLLLWQVRTRLAPCWLPGTVCPSTLAQVACKDWMQACDEARIERMIDFAHTSLLNCCLLFPNHRWGGTEPRAARCSAFTGPRREQAGWGLETSLQVQEGQAAPSLGQETHLHKHHIASSTNAMLLDLASSRKLGGKPRLGGGQRARAGR